MFNALPVRRLRSIPVLSSGGVRRRVVGASALVMLAASVLTAQEVVVPQTRTPAQDAAAGLGKTVSNSDIATAIKSSGLSEADVRAKLQKAGFDSKLADPFFVPGAPPVALAPKSAIEAMTSIGLLSLGAGTPGQQGEAQKQSQPAEKEKAAKEESKTEAAAEQPKAGPQVFGREVFSSRSNAFDPDLTSPVDANYRLGIGDNLQVVLTGQVEEAYQTEVRQDGKVLLPMIGFTSVAGLTLEAARTVLKTAGSRVYSGLRNGGTKLDLAVTKLRTNQVFVIGEVEHPGSYMVSGMSTAFHAIARAGGPSDRGSFRDIEIRRSGAVVKRIDLYDYLIRGDASADLNTAQGDVVFVPPAKRIVQVQGFVRHEGIFELKEGEKFKELIFFAGGLLPTAATNRIQIDRILPADLRRPGVDRVVLDVPVSNNKGVLDTLTLLDNDIVNVFSIGTLRRNTARVTGAVFQPGTYEWKPGMKLGGLLAKADGVLPGAVADRIKITRNVGSDGRMGIISVSLTDSAGVNTPVNEFDDVFVLDQRDGSQTDTVNIAGAVHKPGARTWAVNLTLGDLIDLANGLQPWAVKDDVFIQRAELATQKASIVRVNLADTASRHILLQPNDWVAVPDARIAFPPTKVNVSGAVFLPGDATYGAGMTLGALIDVSGGLREEAQFIDVSRRVFSSKYTDSTAIVKRYAISGTARDSAWRAFPLEAQDRIAVRTSPGYKHPGSVTLVGAFAYPGSYTITSDGERLSSVLERAGGTLPTAFAASFRMVRNGRPVPVQLARVRQKDRTDDILLADGDQLMIEVNPNVVNIGGAVERPASVPYRSNWGLDDYINAAGGFTTQANSGSVIVTYASGAVKRKHGGWLGIGSSSPSIEPGATVMIGTKDTAESADWSKTLMTTMQVTTSIVSLVLAYVAIKK
jgi:polysaccharide export outer membrane protein